MKKLFYANLDTLQPSDSAAGERLTLAPFVFGREYGFGLRLLKLVEGRVVETDLAVRSLRASLGRIDERPTGGTVRLQVGPGVSTADNTVASFGPSVKARELEQRINNLASKPYGDAKVEWVSGSWLIWFPAAVEQPVLNVRENRLRPLAAGRLLAAEIDGEWMHDLRLIQAPVATTASAERVVPPGPSIERIQSGGTEAGFAWNEIQELTLPPEFRGTYQIRHWDGGRTVVLNRADGPEEIQAAVNALWDEAGFSVTVTNPQRGRALIEFNGEEFRGLPLPMLEVLVFTAPPGDLTFFLDVRRAQAAQLLREQDNVDVTLAVDLEVVGNEAALEDPEAPGRWIPAVRTSARLVRPLNFEELATVSEHDWLHPFGPRDYIPFTPDQIMTGQQFYAAVVGDGEAVEFMLEHNMDTGDVAVAVRENVSGGQVLASTEYVATVESGNVVKVTFPDAPAENAYRVLVVGGVSREVWNAHTHTIPQVVNLEDMLDDFGLRLQTLESILPQTGPGAGPDAQAVGLTIIIPEVEEVLFYRGEEPLSFDGQGSPENLPRRAPAMLPAIHTATVDAFPAEPLPVPSETAGTVWEHTGSERLLLPGGNGIRSSWVEPGGHVASDGRMIFPADRWQETNSYYPAPFLRELWAFAINDRMLRVGRRLECVFGVRTQLVGADSKAQWVLVVEKGTAPSQADPDPTAVNLEDIVWDATPVLSQRIVLSRLLQSHFFGVRIRRLSGGMEMDRQLYGVWEGATAEAPADANFVLRARMVKWDTENSAPEARGWVFLAVTGGVETGADGSQSTQPARAVIT